MSAVEGLLTACDRFVRLHCDQELAGPQKVWFASFDPSQERLNDLHYPNAEKRGAREAAATAAKGDWNKDRPHRGPLPRGARTLESTPR